MTHSGKEHAMRLVLVLAVLVIGSSVAASGSAAPPPGAFNVYGCSQLQGGHVTVPADTALEARGGWAAKTRGLVQDFMSSQTTTLSMDGGQPVEMAAFYGSIAQSGPDDWGVRFAYGLQPLSSGQSTTVVESIVLPHRIPDGIAVQTGDNSKPYFWGPGTLTWTCMVTAA
jgi:hypothetical protein